MAQETFARWDAWWWYSDVPSVAIEAIYDDIEGFRVVITAAKCPATRISVSPGKLILYRAYDEFGLSGLDHSGVRPGHCFYRSDSSPLLSEASKMNSVVYGGTAVHYAIYTGDRCIDIISAEEPRFALLREFASGRYDSERPERPADERKSVYTDLVEVGPNHASSTKGFQVKFHPAGGVDYTDHTGTIRVDTELYVKPLRIMIYRESNALQGMEQAQAREVLGNIQSALEFLGHRNEIG
jgi:hypothetical protein